VNIFGGQLYASDSSGSAVRAETVGTGLPTTAGQTITNLPGFPTADSPYAYYFAHLNSGVAGLNTLYVAEDTTGGGQIQKYELIGGNWTAEGTITASAVRGLAGVTDGTIVTLHGTTGGSGATGGGALYTFTDTTGTATVSGSAATIATASNDKAFRGVVFIPAAAANPPVLTTSAGSLSFLQGQAPAIIDPGATVSDSDPGTLVGASVAITTNFASGQDVVGFTNQAGITGLYSGGVLTLSSVSPLPVATYQAALRTVTLSTAPNGSPISTLPRTATFTADDGQLTNNLSIDRFQWTTDAREIDNGCSSMDSQADRGTYLDRRPSGLGSSGTDYHR
jgi:hypothetical protein